MADEDDSFPLHKAVFENDLKTLSRLLRKHNVATKRQTWYANCDQSQLIIISHL